MNILLDTHVIIWALTDDERLPVQVKEVISDNNNLVYYSIASLWEIAIKHYKMPDKCPYDEKTIAQYCKCAGYFELAIKQEHIEAIKALKVKKNVQLCNYDPFDRILLSQAKSEGMRIISHDTNFDNYDEKCIVRI